MKRPPLLAACLLAASLAPACVGDEPAPSTEAGIDSVAMDADVADSAGIDSSGASRPPSFDPFPSLPGEGEPRTYRLRLVNRLASRTFVYATAGAGRVLLDTVPASDSLDVDVRLRADHVDLDAVDEEGRSRSMTTLQLLGDEINRWIIADRPTSSGAGAALVRVGPARYPRTRSE